jgi:hypothetical protein
LRRAFRGTSSGNSFAVIAAVIDGTSDMQLPYARPKVGRRASDRKLLEEWYARHASRVEPEGEGRRLASLHAPPGRAAECAPRPPTGPDRRAAMVSPAAG